MAQEKTKKIYVSQLVRKDVKKRKTSNPISEAVAKEWHPDLNGEWLPSDFSRGSNYYAFFLCPKSTCGCPHVWDSSICNRAKRGCPWCSGDRVCPHNSLKAIFPLIAMELHPTKNGKITADDIFPASNIDYWWICPKKTDCGCAHEYEATPANRTRNELTCPFKGCCRSPKKFCKHESLAGTHPDIAKYWDTEKNKKEFGLDSAENVSHGSTSVEVHWKCPNVCPAGTCLHTWQSTVASMCRKTLDDEKQVEICPFCSGRRICEHTSLQSLYPHIASELYADEAGNPVSASQVHGVSGNIMQWKCPQTCPMGCEHIYPAIVSNRTKLQQDCPYPGCCPSAPKLTCIHTSLRYLYPDLASQWHPTKNTVTPDRVLPFSNAKVWWICKEKHEWAACISDRHRNGCPKCRYKTEAKFFEKMLSKYPELMRQFTAEWCKNIRVLPFDFALQFLKILFEIDGPHHFRQVSNWTPPDEVQARDQYKMECAKENGYSVIRLVQEDVLFDKWDWFTAVCELVDRLIETGELFHGYVPKSEHNRDLTYKNDF